MSDAQSMPLAVVTADHLLRLMVIGESEESDARATPGLAERQLRAIRVMQSQGMLNIEQMCQASGVSRARFYRGWEQKTPDQAAMALRDAILRASLEHPRYGAAKVAEVLRRAGWVVSLTRVRVRRQDNLLAVKRRKFVVTTEPDHDFLGYPNLAQHMVLTAINQLWVADITYLRLASEFVYFAVVLDAFSRDARSAGLWARPYMPHCRWRR